MPKLQKVIVGAIVVLAFATLFISLYKIPAEKQVPPQKVGSSTVTRASYDVIGTAAASSTLTGTYSDNQKVIVSTGIENIHLDIRYSTGSSTSTAKYAYVLVEGSNDDGATYFPLAAKVVNTTEVDLYVKDLDGNIGIPVIVPGDKVTANTTTYKGGYDSNFVADHIRISAKEALFGTGTAGNIYVRATLTSTN